MQKKKTNQDQLIALLLSKHSPNLSRTPVINTRDDNEYR